MNLFEILYDDEKLHTNFKSLLPDTHSGEREVLQNWSEGFPDRDKKFVHEFQTTFNSSFWELYLYKLFKEMEFEFDWSFPSPDFALEHNGVKFIVEATISNNAHGEVTEWQKENLKNVYDDYLGSMNEKNVYSIIRLANSFFSKLSKYKDVDKHKTCYKNLPHVENKPFILAITAFEQPLHYHQYDRPIMALLYDFYVDEEEYWKHPRKYPNGPPDKSLEYVEKENGNMIMLGLFMDDRASEISAVLFNPLATVGKVLNMIKDKEGLFAHTWLTDENVLKRTMDEEELIEDGLFIFHNPYAKYPLSKDIFDKERICQVFMDKRTQKIEKSFGKKHLSSRFAVGVSYINDEN
jgi:hypothetical protein